MQGPVSLDELVAFLLRARSQALACADGDRIVAAALPRGRRRTYRQGDLAYIDTAVGAEWLAGQETVYWRETPLWAMCYTGGMTVDFVMAAEIFPFLQRALAQVTPERPFRGPHILRDGHHLYVDESQGTMERFQGTESISFRNQPVYQLRYMGGVLR